jgi:hypothetical protein
MSDLGRGRSNVIVIKCGLLMTVPMGYAMLDGFDSLESERDLRSSST